MALPFLGPLLQQAAVLLQPIADGMPAGIEGNFMAHGYCFDWEKPLVALHVTSDVVTGLAYYAISAAIFYFAYRRRDMPFLRIFILFGIFILACGTTHLFGAYTIFRPAYWPEGYIKAFTAIVSVLAAVLFIPLIPEAIGLPSLKAKIAEIERLNAELEITDRTLQKVLDPILWVGEDGRILRVNDSACSALRYTREELQRLAIFDLEPRMTAESWRAHWEALKARGSARVEARHRSRDGHLMDVEVSLDLITHRDSAFVCVVTRDITRRKEDERRIGEETAKLRTLIRSMPDLVWLKDPQGIYLLCNQRFEAFFGVPESQIVGRTDYDFAARELADFFRAHDLRAIRAGGPSVNEEWITFASDGHRELLETIKTPVLDATGQCFGVLGIGRDITRIRESQEGLRKLSKAVEQSPVGVMITDSVGCIEYVNPRFTQVTGYELEDVKGKTPRVLSSGLTSSETYVELWKTILSGQVWQGEIQNRRKGGEHYWEAISIAPVFDESSVLTHFVALQEDITGRRQAEQALAASERRYHSLFDAMQEGFALHEILPEEAGRSFDYRFLDVNPAFETMTGVSQDHWLGRTVREAIPELEPAWLEAYEQVARTGRPVRFESYAARLGRWFQVFVYTPGERLLAVLTFDVTERTAIQTELRKSEQQFRTLTENIPFVVVRFDRELRHLYINPAIEAVAGRPAAAFLGRTNEELGMPAELVAFWNGKLREAFERSRNLKFEFEFPTPEGNRFFVSTLVPERNAAGEVETVLSVVVDITAQRRSERALTTQLEELRSWHEAMLGRESRIMELKREVNDLRGRLGQPPRYGSTGGDGTGEGSR